jgi:hypothetical protein
MSAITPVVGGSSAQGDTEKGSPVDTAALVIHDAATDEQPQSFCWNFIHSFSFFLGGFTFIIGSLTYYWPNSTTAAQLGAALYVLGSCGFLAVDVLEWFTFTTVRILRMNITVSAIGSFLYVLGSIGFVPSVAVERPLLGPYGFILGSAFIGCSQLWKSYRILCGGDERTGSFQLVRLKSKEFFTQVGVELNAGIGAWFFFFSTIVYLRNMNTMSTTDSVYLSIVDAWVIGSFFFFFGSLFLGYRHFVMGK